MSHRRRLANAIDPASGFKVPLENLVRQWDGEYVDRRFVDPRHPQDFVRGVRDDQSLPYARPEAPDTFILGPILTQDGNWIYTQDGQVILTQGSAVRL